MQIQTEKSHTLQITEDLSDSSCEMSSQQLLQKSFAPKNDEWLSEQFKRLPFRLYQLWLVISIVIALKNEFDYIWGFFLDAHELSYSKVNFMDYYKLHLFFYNTFFGLFWIPHWMLLFYGSIEMLLAMKQKKAKLVQKSISRFQSCLVCFLGQFLFIYYTHITEPTLISSPEVFLHFLVFFFSFIPLIGGFGVARVFKKSHLLQKSPHSEDEMTKDFLMQNEAIESEVQKYNQQLNKCVYLIYKWWLKCGLLFEIVRVFFQFKQIRRDYSFNDLSYRIFPDFVGLFLFFCLSAWSCLKMDAVIATKELAASNKALICLKISVVVSILAFIFFGRSGSLDLLLSSRSGTALSYLFSFAYCCLIPIVALLGALKAHKIIEQRDRLVQVLSFAGDTYL